METSSSTSAVSRSSAVVGLDEDSTYRSISVLAIVSLLLGLVAPLSLFAPLILVIPIAGIVAAFFALRRIAASDGALVGRAAALVGLALSIASVTASFTRTTLTTELLSRQARAAAVDWFSHLQAGEADKAFELTVTSRQPPPSKAPPGAPEGAAAPQVPPIDTFRADPVVHFLLDHAQGAEVKYVRDMAVDPTPASPRIQQLFAVGVPATEGAAPETQVELIMQRVRGYNGAASRWLVSAYKSDDVPLDADGHDHSAHHVH